MRHHLNIAQYSILAAFALFLILMILFSIEGEYVGQVTSTTVNISPSAPAVCYFTIGAGYNIISMPCLSTAELVTNVTSGTPMELMYQYVPSGTDRWKVYNPSLPSYVVSDLQFMTRRAGYIVIASGAANKSFDGRRVSLTDVPIVPGWNLVGYPTNRTENISTATASIAGSFDRITAYNKSSESYVSYPGTLEQVAPGIGYWINGTAPDSWTVTW